MFSTILTAMPPIYKKECLDCGRIIENRCESIIEEV